MTSVEALAARMRAVELRLSEIESSYAETQYGIQRRVTGIGITLERMAAQMNVPVATDADIDEALDQG